MKRKYAKNTLPSNSLGMRRHLAMVKLQTPRSQRKVKKRFISSPVIEPEIVYGGDLFHGAAEEE